MSVVVTCRRCGRPFEINVIDAHGEWWLRCPHCHTEEPRSTVTTAPKEEPDDPAAA